MTPIRNAGPLPDTAMELYRMMPSCGRTRKGAQRADLASGPGGRPPHGRRYPPVAAPLAVS